MSGQAVALMLVAAAMLVLRGGDCVSLLFADQEASDCCTRGHCSPAKNSDSCCQASSSSAAKHFLPETKSSVPEISLDWLPVQISPTEHPQNLLSLPLAASESPPGTPQRLSLPLRI